MRKARYRQNKNSVAIHSKLADVSEQPSKENSSPFNNNSHVYKLELNDRALLTCAKLLLEKVIVCRLVDPAECVSIAKLVDVFSRLPEMTKEHNISVSIGNPLSHFGDVEVFHYWELAVKGTRLSITGGGYFDQLQTESDRFLVKWTASPNTSPEFRDFLSTFSEVPEIRPLLDMVMKIDFGSRLFHVHVTDPDNLLLRKAYQIWAPPI